MIPLSDAGIAQITSVVNVIKLYIHLKIQFYVISMSAENGIIFVAQVLP